MPLSNNPPRDADDFQLDVEKIQSLLDNWDGVELDKDSSGLLHKDIELIAALKKEADASHKAYKEPHLAAGRKVDDAFRPVRTTFDGAHKKLKHFLSSYLAEQQRVQREAAAKAAEEAKAKAREAADAENAFLATEDEARQAEIEAKRAARHADAAGISKAGNGRAISLRTYYDVSVTDSAAMVAHYASHPDVIAAAEKLAKSEARTSKGEASIPGVTIIEEQRAS